MPGTKQCDLNMISIFEKAIRLRFLCQTSDTNRLFIEYHTVANTQWPYTERSSMGPTIYLFRVGIRQYYYK